MKDSCQIAAAILNKLDDRLRGVRFLYIMTHFARGTSAGNGGSMAALSITRPPLKALKDHQ